MRTASRPTQFQDEDLIALSGDSLYLSPALLPALLGAVLVSDALFWFTGVALYARASEWLLAAGLASGVLAAADWLIRYIATGHIRPSRACKIHLTGKLLALLLTGSNLIYRLNEDTSVAVVPIGIALTAIIVGLMAATVYLGKAFASEVPAEAFDDGDLLRD